MSATPEPPPAARTPPPATPPRPPGGRFDALLVRTFRVAGLLVGVGEVWMAQAVGRAVDANVLLFAATLLGLPLVLGGGAGRGEP